MSIKTKPGEVYLKTALKVGVQSNCCVPMDIIRKSALEDLEPLFGIIPYIEMQCKVLTYRLWEKNISAPYTMSQILIYSNNPKYRLRGLVFKIEQLKLSEIDKMEIVLLLLRSTHQVWVKNHPEEFFEPELADDRCRYMAFELVGYCEIDKYCLSYVEGLLQLLEWKVNKDLLQALYYRQQEDFIKKYELNIPEAIADFVKKGIECPLPKEVFNYFQTEEGEKTVWRMISILV